MDLSWGETEGKVRRFFQIGCAPRPDIPLTREMTKDEAILKVVEAFREQFPECFVVTTYLSKVGFVHNFVVSVTTSGREDE